METRDDRRTPIQSSHLNDTPVRVLMVADSSDDAKTVELLLTRAGYNVSTRQVISAEEFTEAITYRPWDVVLAEYAIPGFGALQALDLLKQSGKDIPLIIVSAASDTAVSAMRAGARDYLLKDDLARLVPAIEREMRESETRRKKSEADEAVRYLSAIVESSDDAIIGKTLDGIITSWNRGAELLYGYSAPEMLGRSISVLIPPDCQDELALILGRVKRGECVEQHETLRRRKNGTLVEVSVKVSPIIDTSGKLIGASTIARDISAHTQTKGALRESELRFRTIFEMSADLIVVADMNGRFELVNAAFERTLGYSRDELVSRPYIEFIHPDDRESTRQIIKEKLEHGMTILSFENRYVRKDGGIVWLEWSSQPLDERLTLAVARDVTQRKEAERQLSADFDALTRLQRIGTLFVREGNFDQILREIVEGAIAISGADFGNMQLLDAESGQLRIVAHRGFPQWWIDFWNTVTLGKGVCGTAMQNHARVIVEDVEQSEIFVGKPALEMQLKVGVRAVQSTPLIGRSGKVLGMFSTHFKKPHRPSDRTLHLLDLLARQATDIIERTQAEEALRESESRMMALLDSLPVAVWFADPTGQLINSNRAAREIFGEAPLLPLSEYKQYRAWWPDSGKQLESHDWALAQAILTGQSVRHDLLEIEDIDGKRKLVRNIGFPVSGPNGENYGGAAVMEDITEAKLREHAQRESERRFRALAENVPQMIWVADAAANFQYLSRKWLEFTGTTAEQNANGRWVEAIHPEDRERAAESWRAAVLARRTYETEYRLRRHDGEYRWQLARAVPLPDPSSNADLWFGTTTDIQDQKNSEQALIRSEKLAALGRMAATIAHEVNNPLAAVMNSIFLASSDPTLSPQTRDTLELADQELRRAAHITSQTLVFCRETGSRTALKLPKVVDDVLGVYERKIRERGINVRQSHKCGPCGQNCEFCFAGNAAELRQVVSNLLGNAIDALQDKGTLQVRLRRISYLSGGGPKVQLTIADNGSGIRTENLRRVFEPFFTTKESLGTGLGLWITEQIVKKYGGSIRVRSQAKRGTVFQITLPAIPAGVATVAGPFPS